MTLAQMTKAREDLLSELRPRVTNILRQSAEPMSLSTIEFYLMQEAMNRGQRGVVVNTFDVRDAVFEMIDNQEAEFTIGRKVRLIKR